MILVQGTRGPGFNSRIAPFSKNPNYNPNKPQQQKKQYKKMQCSISQLTYTYPHPQQIKQLNLSSTSSIKIHEIAHLENFTRLRVLVLSNNMITFMGGLDRLVQLRVINLEFNRIRVVEGTRELVMLQEMFLGYNEIQRVTDCVLSNTKLRVLHLAYNDIRTLDSISILYHNPQQSPSLPNLTTLSLYGNPITSTITYLSFFKMLIPSLRYMDDKSLDDDLMGGAVCPQEEVLILRDAISKLLDERDQAVERLEGFVQGEGKGRRKSVSPIRPAVQQTRAADLKTERTNSQILNYLQTTKQKYTIQLQTQRDKITKISKLYTQNLKHTKSKTPLSPDYNYLPDSSPEKSPASVEQGWLQNNKEIIRELKIEDQRLQDTQEKIRNVNKIIGYIRDRLAGGDWDVYRVVLQMVLFGFQLKEGLSLANCQKLCKKYLIKSSTQTGEGQPELNSGLIEYSQILKQVIYGQHSDRPPKAQLSQILKLKTKIRNKGLLQIITQLKQISSQECSKSSKFEKEKKDFIEQFEKQSEELSRAWDQLKREKEKFQGEKRKEIREIGEEMGRKEQEMRRKYKIAEEEERAKIVQLKRSRERLEDDQERIKLELAETQQRLNRKYTQLEQFQAHFNEFIVEKQQIKSLEEQINEITNSLHTEKQRHETLVDRVKQLTLQQGILQSKLAKCEETLSQRSKDLMEIQKLKNQTVRLYEKYKGEVEREAEKLRELTAGLARKVEEVRDYERMGDRMKKNLGLLEEKVRNIEQMEQSKKLAIKQLQLSLKQLKQDKQILLGQTDSLDKNIQQKREQLIKCQLKLQQNRLAMQNLSDLNRSVNDMMIRQSELKRSIIELEIQNKNLMDMKNSLMGDYRIKNYL